jgi:hypothetical protein
MKSNVGMSELNYCDVLSQNTKRLFRILRNPTRIKTSRHIIYSAFQCGVSSRTTSKPTNNLTIYNKETQLLAYADDIDIVGRSQSAVRNVYLALEGEAG